MKRLEAVGHIYREQTYIGGPLKPLIGIAGNTADAIDELTSGIVHNDEVTAVRRTNIIQATATAAGETIDAALHFRPLATLGGIVRTIGGTTKDLKDALLGDETYIYKSVA